MKKNKLIISIVALFLVALMYGQGSFKSEKDFVPDKATAIKIAEILWLNVYGDRIYEKKPFTAKLKNGKIWVVQGTLHADVGGVPYIEIQKSDCKVLKMSHGK
jgi:NTF2 fold immunity protein